MYVLLVRLEWTSRLAAISLGVLTGLAVALASIGYVEFATRHLLLNPKVIASNQLEDYFRVNSLFFDPNIYGRFLAVVLVLLVAWMLWRLRDPRRRARRRGRGVPLRRARAHAVAVELRGAAGRPRRPRRAALERALGAAASPPWSALAALVAFALGTTAFDGGSSSNKATSGRADLISGGVHLFADRPLQGWGSGSFAREYRRAEHVSAERATSASHTIPVTVAAEQGVIGLLAYLALLVLAFLRLFRGRRGRPGARRRRGRVRGARRAHVHVRRVPRGPADLGAARASAPRSPRPPLRASRTRRSPSRSRSDRRAPRSAGDRRPRPRRGARVGARPDLSELRRLLPPRLGPRAAARAQADLRGLPGADRASALRRAQRRCSWRSSGAPPIACSCSSRRCRSSRSSGPCGGSGARCSGRWPGVLAALLTGSSFALLLYAARAYVDVPFLALVLWAAALEAERPRRGTLRDGAARRRRAAAPGGLDPRRRVLAVDGLAGCRSDRAPAA